jgi:hypothetical protein
MDTIERLHVYKETDKTKADLAINKQFFKIKFLELCLTEKVM